MFRFYFVFCFLFLSINALSQKKIIDYTVYNTWKSLKNESISASGKYVAYEINPHRGDGILHIYNTETNEEALIPRGKKATFGHNEDIIAFTIHPGYDTLRTLELKKVKKEKWVKDTLGIYWLASDSLVKIPNVLSYKMGKKGNNLAYVTSEDTLKKEEKKKWFQLFKRKSKEETIVSDGHTLFILNVFTKKIKSFDHVVKYEFNRQGTHLYFTTHQKVDKNDVYHLHLYNINSEMQ